MLYGLIMGIKTWGDYMAKKNERELWFKNASLMDEAFMSIALEDVKAVELVFKDNT